MTGGVDHPGAAPDESAGRFGGNPVERQEWLLRSSRSAGRVAAAEAADELGVSVETVRRDLAVLERSGLVRRYHGGAIPVERAGLEMPLIRRGQVKKELKRRLAEAAVQELAGAESIFIDEGSSTAVVADVLNPSAPLRVVTSSLVAALEVASHPMIEAIQLGGQVRGKTLSAMSHWAVHMLSDFVLDVAIIGATGVSARYGLTCGDTNVAAVKSAAIAASRRIVLIADSAKIGTDSAVRFGRLREGDTLVTDRVVATSSALRVFRRAKVKIVQV